MRADVEEQMAVLRRGIFGAVGRREAHCQHHWLAVVLLLGLAEKGNRVVGDEVGVVVFGVVKAVFLRKKLRSNKVLGKFAELTIF